MALRVSSGARNKMMGAGRPDIVGHMVATTISFDNASAEIRDSGNGLLAAGFLAGDEVYPLGTTSNNSMFKVTAALAGALTVTPAPTTEAAGTSFSLAAAQGKDNGGFKDVFRNGVLRIYSGSQPADPDDAASGTLLLEVTVDGGTFAHGDDANALNWADAVLGVIQKEGGDTWKAAGLADGTAGWFRFCANPTDAGGSSTSLARVDGSVGTSGADLLLVSTAIVTDDIYYINSAQFTLPMQYGL